MIDIYMIEDDDMDIELMTMALGETGLAFTLHVAVDGESGLGLLMKAGFELPAPALILLDLNIRQISGLELLPRARAMPALMRVPIVVFSGSLNPHDRQAALELGATAFIQKPVDIDGYFAVGLKIAAMVGHARDGGRST